MDSLNPILKPSPEAQFTDPVTGRIVHWEARNVLNPTAVVKDGKVYLLYRAQDASGTSRIGLAESEDGLHFRKVPAPVLFPDNDGMKQYEWSYLKSTGSSQDCKNCFDGVEDPRVVAVDSGGYVMTYTSYDGKTARLSLATSKDLKTWTKQGLVLRDSAFRNTWSKSGAIVVQQTADGIVAAKINGSYWMYFGDTDLFMASSQNLVDWKPMTDPESGRLIAVLHPRPGYFDSRLVESGPFALEAGNQILLLYNSSNSSDLGDPSLPRFTYSAGQALFDIAEPYKLIDRKPTYLIHPDRDYEKTGEVNNVCFVEGLVSFNDRWFLYYGTADSRIAVAVGEGLTEAPSK